MKRDFAEFEFEDVPCCVCGERNFELVHLVEGRYKEGTLRFVKCKNDGLIHQNPAPTKDSLMKFFNSSSFVSQKGTDKAEELTGYFDYLSGEKFRHKMAQERMALLKKFKPGEKLDILKIAPGTGIFLKLAKEAGHNEMGIDASEYFVNYAKKQHDINMVHSAFEDYDFGQQRFDVILIFGAIMNVSDPAGFLGKAHSLLKPSGQLHTNIIGADNWVYKWQKEKFWIIRPPVLNFFNRSNFETLLGNLGFSVKYNSSEWQYTHLDKLANFSKVGIVIKLVNLLKLNMKIIKTPIPGARYIIAEKSD